MKRIGAPSSGGLIIIPPIIIFSFILIRSFNNTKIKPRTELYKKEYPLPHYGTWNQKPKKSKLDLDTNSLFEEDSSK